jgi:flavin reductase (DIM6/NTAB) family NADH-FMN oxidoreductase RutF
MTKESLNFPVIGSDALKTAFRMHASGVAIITSHDDAGLPIGFTATSVTSLGSNPPLVSFNIARGSSSYPQLIVGREVAIHTLCAKNLELAQRMAGPKEERFLADDFQLVGNLPILPSASSILIGKVRERFEVEANAVVILDILRGTEALEEERPLLYYKRGYLTATERLADNS